MNWNRVLTGMLVAAGVLWVFDVGNVALTQRVMVTEPNLTWMEILSISMSLIMPSFVIGVLLSWLYALVRPRLGPGPKTALLMGTVGFLFSNPDIFSFTMWMSAPPAAFIPVVLSWAKFAVATYVAGWQYIEKAP